MSPARPQRSVPCGSRILSATLAILLSACGYHFTARKDALPTEGKRIFAPTFSNDTPEPGLEVVFTNAFRAELANAGAAGESDSVVRAVGNIGSLGGGAGLVYTNTGGVPTQPTGQPSSTASFYVAVTACIRLVQADKDLASTCVSGTEDYAPGVDALSIEAARRVALQRLSVRLMKEAFDKLSSNF